MGFRGVRLVASVNSKSSVMRIASIIFTETENASVCFTIFLRLNMDDFI